MSALEKNIFYMLLDQVGEGDLIEKEYLIDLTVLEKKMGSLTLDELDKATNRLMRITYDIRKENGDRLYVGLVGVLKYDWFARSLLLKISRKILPYLVALKKNYTTYRLNVALSLRSKYSKRMYEMLSQFKEQGVMELSVDELKYRLALKDPKTGKEQYENWPTFKEHILEIPQKELSEKSDLSFSYEAKKTGKKYTSLVFHIKPLPQN